MEIKTPIEMLEDGSQGNFLRRQNKREKMVEKTKRIVP